MSNTPAKQVATRRRRYERSGNPKHGMTPKKARLLLYVAECGMLTTKQVARIAGMSVDATYKHLSDLFEMEMLDRIAVPYANVAPPGKDGPNLAFGPGENINAATKQGLQYLHRAELISDELAARKLPDYGPKNALFLAHELLVRDVRVWLELCIRAHGGDVEKWVDGPEAYLPPARPDAWFLYRLPNSERTLVGLVEADRGTERGNQWERKAHEYDRMLKSDALANATGGRRRGRLVVVVQTEARRERIAALLADSPVAGFSYVATAEDLLVGGMEREVWNNPPSEYLVPLLPANAL